MPALFVSCVELSPRFLERRDIDFLYIGEMWDLPLRLLQMLGDGAAQADDRHFLDPIAPRKGRRCWSTRRLRARGDVQVEILMGDAPGRAPAGHELQFDAEIPGPPPD